MRYLQLIGVLGLMLSSAVWADGGKSVMHPARQSAHARQRLPRATQRLVRHQAEVKRLEQDVARQESDSKQASERLQQQDQAIADLQRQLQALHAGSAAAQH
jgi:septal ring factor EnvC (AmiA/AmiB activator)